jgi:aryl sulfotransferase
MLGMMESQTHRRCLKTHLPRDAMVWNPDIKYIFVGRDGRDAVWSAHNHFNSATAQFYELFASGPPFDGPKLVRPSDDPRDLFQELLDDETSGKQLWPFWSHIRSWWETRNQPNVLFLHYNDLKADLDGEMRKVAKFLEIPDMSEEKWNACVEHCTFNWMKKNADLAAPPQAADVFAEGAQSFIYKGTNSRWKDVLTEEECKAYEERAKKELGEECATWLQYGSKKP